MYLEKPKADGSAIDSIIFGSVFAKVFIETVRLKLYDHLEKPMKFQEIANAVDLSPFMTEMILKCLVEHELVTREKDYFCNTQIASEFLVSTSPYSQHKIIELTMGNCDFVCANISELVKTPGQTSGEFRKRFAMLDSIEGIKQHSKRGSLQDTVSFISKLPCFQNIKTLCDVGGSHGSYSMELLNRNPNLTAIIAELPPAIPVIEQIIEQTEYNNRLFAVPYDLRKEQLPENSYDCVLVSHVLQVFEENLEETIAKLASSVVPGGWLISNHMCSKSSTDPIYKSRFNLYSGLFVNASHFIDEQRLELAFQKAGLKHFIKGNSGVNDINLILAAKKV
ncbi:MAG: methyltransferase [Opitutales bacterium]|nr:methyltransferase [Opitutales bacterium]